MEPNHQDIEERLWTYIDGTSAAGERSAIEQLIQSNAAWKTKYRELLEVSELIRSSELEAPSMRFTKNVMEEIAKLHIAPATKTYINNRLIWGLGIFFITMIIGFLIYGFGQIDWTVQGDITISKYVNKINYNQFFNNTYMNVFMMINVVLGLFLVDRYLANKRKKYREEV